MNSALQNIAVQYKTLQYSAVQCSALQYSALQNIAVQCIAEHCSTVWAIQGTRKSHIMDCRERWRDLEHRYESSILDLEWPQT